MRLFSFCASITGPLMKGGKRVKYIKIIFKVLVVTVIIGMITSICHTIYKAWKNRRKGH